MQPQQTHSAFTLIELLVVITIIVVLLALLTPALDKAIYQAELAICGSRVRGIAQGATAYSADAQRAYPYRPSYRVAIYRRANIVKYAAQADDLPRLTPYVQRGLFIDPLTPFLKSADLDTGASLEADTSLYVNYSLWWDWQYTHPTSAAPGSARLGRGFVFNGQTYPVLVSDEDLVSQYLHHSNSHNGKLGLATLQGVRNVQVGAPVGDLGEKETLSRWLGVRNDRVDSHFAMNDVSVRRVTDVEPQDNRGFGRVPIESDYPAAWVQSGEYVLLPTH